MPQPITGLIAEPLADPRIAAARPVADPDTEAHALETQIAAWHEEMRGELRAIYGAKDADALLARARRYVPAARAGRDPRGTQTRLQTRHREGDRGRSVLHGLSLMAIEDTIVVLMHEREALAGELEAGLVAVGRVLERFECATGQLSAQLVAFTGDEDQTGRLDVSIARVLHAAGFGRFLECKLTSARRRRCARSSRANTRGS